MVVVLNNMKYDWTAVDNGYSVKSSILSPANLPGSTTEANVKVSLELTAPAFRSDATSVLYAIATNPMSVSPEGAFESPEGPGDSELPGEPGEFVGVPGEFVCESLLHDANVSVAIITNTRMTANTFLLFISIIIPLICYVR